jgi:hypothetical protein
MIWESSYWKDDLLKVAKRLKKRNSQTRWSERSLACVEKDIFILFYAIRKLIESKKLSDSVLALQIAVTQYPSTGKLATLLNSHRLDRLYDFANGRSVFLGLPFLSNQIIHSYVLVPLLGEEGTLEGMLFCSDHKRNTNAYELSILETIKLMNRVGSDYPSSGHFLYDAAKQDYVVSNN